MAGWDICRECGDPYHKERKEQVFCSHHCARVFEARKGIPSERDKDARFIDEVLAAHHRIWPEGSMTKGDEGYLTRRQEQEGARQAAIERKRAEADIKRANLTAAAEQKHLDAAKKAHDDAARELTAMDAIRVFWQKFKGYLS